MTKEDSEKIRRLYELYEQPMYRIAVAVLHKSEFAEDAVSDAFIRIIQRLHRIKDPESPATKSYIVKVIRSTSINIYRKNRNFYTHELSINEDTMQIPDSQQNVEETIIEYDEQSEHKRLIGSLNETDRSIIELRYSDELPWRDVAEKLSLNESTVRKRFQRAKKSLKKLKGEMLDEEYGFSKKY